MPLLVRRRHREPLAPLRPATLQHLPAGLVAHAFAETVRPVAMALLRLIRSLHSRDSSAPQREAKASGNSRFRPAESSAAASPSRTNEQAPRSKAFSHRINRRATPVSRVREVTTRFFIDAICARMTSGLHRRHLTVEIVLDLLARVLLLSRAHSRVRPRCGSRRLQ
jgi:hypothetical protein